jgi:hypothetical protein
MIYAGCSTAWTRIHIGCTIGRAHTYACFTTDRSCTYDRLIYVEACCLILVGAKDVS